MATDLAELRGLWEQAMADAQLRHAYDKGDASERLLWYLPSVLSALEAAMDMARQSPMEWDLGLGDFGDECHYCEMRNGGKYHADDCEANNLAKSLGFMGVKSLNPEETTTEDEPDPVPTPASPLMTYQSNSSTVVRGNPAPICAVCRLTINREKDGFVGVGPNSYHRACYVATGGS